MTSFAHDTPDLAETYDRTSDTQFEGGKRLFDRLGLGPEAHVLDVGCGTGRLATWIAERLGPGGAVTGVDPLEDRIRIARSRGSAVRFEVGRAEDLGAFPDASFDGVCMSSVFHWIADQPKALAEAARVLRPGGRLGVTTFPGELRAAGTVAEILRPLLGRAPYAGRLDLSALPFATRASSTTEIVSAVVGSGLELVELHVTPRVRVHASGADVVDFLQASSFGNMLRVVADELRASLRHDLAAEFDALRGPDGVTLRDWGLLFVAARP